LRENRKTSKGGILTMDFNTALVIIIAIVSVTILGLASIGAYKDYKYDVRAIERNKPKEGQKNDK
jgi:hypothetical protein